MVSTVVSPEFQITVNKKALTGQFLSALQSLKVEEEINLPSMFSFNINIVNPKDNSWQGVNLDTFAPGDVVQISMGLKKPEVLIVGEISALDPTFGPCSSLDVRGYDGLYRLSFGEFTRTFQNQTDGQIAAKMAKEAGLTPKTETPKLTQTTVYQKEISNYNFLLKRIQLYAFEIMVRDKDFIFRASKEGGPPVFTLDYAKDLDEIQLNLRVLTKGSKYEVLGWDAKKGKVIKGEVTGGGSSAKMGGKETGYDVSKDYFDVQRKDPSSKVSAPFYNIQDAASAKTIADGLSQSELNQFIEGEGTCEGNPKVRAGINIGLAGLSQRFNGTYYVTAATHSIDDENGYVTTFKVRRTGV